MFFACATIDAATYKLDCIRKEMTEHIIRKEFMKNHKSLSVDCVLFVRVGEETAREAF